MYCMKCGKEIPEKQAFCDSCLAVMDKFPVKPETRVLLPKHTVPAAVKKAPARKKVVSTEERLVKLRKVVQWLSITLAAAIFALFLSITLLIDSIGPETPLGAIGQNYSTTDTSKNSG